ncbi:MAG: hypothetical protein ACTHWU_01935 [Senegalia sp. (in: firmicutes)]|uniref:hypothetical protein n=1 Tax=Senegalia sp. (in: firmicutes) TaxID=1924098 RepID=UPI003F9C574F
MPKKNFYVYEWFIIDSFEIFYVGKGTGRRKLELHNRSKYFMNIYNKYNCAVRLHKQSLTNEKACKEEIKRIAELKAVGQARCNFTTGGIGFAEGSLNPTAKKPHYGDENGMRTQNIDFSGENNPMYGNGTLIKGERNGMFGKKGFKHPNSKMYEVIYSPTEKDILTYKQCEKKFGIAFSRIYIDGGVLHYKKKTPNSIYEGLEVKRLK